MPHERKSMSAMLRSEFGEQRLLRTTLNYFNRMTLVPREPLQLNPTAWIDWRDGGFGLVVAHPHWPISADGVTLAEGFHPLRDGQKLVVGQTPVTVHLERAAWPVDLSRERELLARDDAAAWAIYADELLARGDPLGAALSKDEAFDLELQLEVRPLLVRKVLLVETDERGAWRALTLRHRLHDGVLAPGVVEAVLGHPRAWFVRRLTLDLTPRSRGFREGFEAQAAAALACVERSASPHLATLHVPGLRSRLTSTRPTLTVTD